jgi:CBS domain-containing protein
MALAALAGPGSAEEQMRIEEVMTRDPKCVTPESPASEAACIMKEEDVGIVPVVDQGSRRLVGVVTDRDLAVRLVAQGRDAETSVREIMSGGELATCRPEEELDCAMETMANEQVRRIPIVDERGTLVGILAQADVVRKAADDRKAEETVERISEPGGRHSQ